MKKLKLIPQEEEINLKGKKRKRKY